MQLALSFSIKFIKENFVLFGKQVMCSPNCMSELTVQLASILLTNIFVGQTTEVLLPWLKGMCCIWYEGKRIHSDKISQAEGESKFWAYESTFNDYNEIAIQFGYITMFAAAFPLAPFAAFINNTVEMRTDGLKLLKANQRPHPRSANSIGNWQEIMQIIACLSILTNCLLVFTTSSSIHIITGNLDGFQKLAFAVAIEHILFALKYLVAKVIPDVPKWVREKNAKKEYLKEAAEQEKLEHELEQDAEEDERLSSSSDQRI